MKARAVWIALLLLIAVATWLRFAQVSALADQGFFTKYTDLADRILAGDTPRDRLGDVSPAYLWLTVALRALGLGLTSIRTAQIAALALGALCCAIAAKKLGGWIAAFTAALLILGNSAVVVVATELEPETLMFLLNAAALAIVLGWDERRSLPRIACGGLLLGLAVVTRPVALATVILVALWLFVRVRRAAVAFVASALVPIVVVLFVNRALTAHAVIMDPGTVFYEAHNPLSTGCAGVMPRIIDDMSAASREPDFLHVAYRIVAARANGTAIDARLSNRYWTGRALAFLRHYPAAAASLVGRQALVALHSYEVFDLITMKRKAIELSRRPGVPFGFILVFALVAFALRAERRDLLVPLFFAVAVLAALLLFNVSARQRNALIPSLAVLGGVGIAEMVRTGRVRPERALLAFGAVVILGSLLGIETRAMREDQHNWWSALQSEALERDAIAAQKAGDGERAAALAGGASLLRPNDRPLVSPTTLRSVALASIRDTDDPRRLFDAAVALETAGAWREATAVLRTIADYRPLRENRAVSSVAYYRARAAIRLGAPRPVVDELLDLANDEAAGDPHVLALRAALGDRESSARLGELHDPFTRDWALARAYADLGDTARSRALLDAVARRMPEWWRVQPAT